MQFPRHAATIGVFCVSIAVAAPAADDDRAGVAADISVTAPDGATIYRVFLTDGTSLVSYGEPTRVGDRVVFSMPTTASLENPPLHLVNLAAARVDWTRTARYAESARAQRYFATKADADYAELTSQVATALAGVSTTTDPAARVAIAEKARKLLAEWPRTHYNYRQAEIGPMLGMLDEIVAELRALSGADQFDLTFVARTDAPVVHEVMLPLPTPQEAIEQVLAAARVSDTSADRLSLMTAALGAIERDAARLSGDWRTETRTAIRTAIASELEIDRQYQLLTNRILRLAEARAKAADVRGVQRLAAEVADHDLLLGTKRPDAVSGLVAALEAHLDGARKLRLARDRWAIRQIDFKNYNGRMAGPLARFARLAVPLEDIKALAGSSPFALAAIQRGAAEATKALSAIAPPDEFRAVHALFLSAAQLADNAAKIRMEAALTGDLRRAWDASSAAAGALMLEAQARTQFKNLFQVPQLTQ
jgi:hypothetical protein